MITDLFFKEAQQTPRMFFDLKGAHQIHPPRILMYHVFRNEFYWEKEGGYAFSFFPFVAVEKLDYVAPVPQEEGLENFPFRKAWSEIVGMATDTANRWFAANRDLIAVLQDALLEHSSPDNIGALYMELANTGVLD